ncbi:hypothetical protein [Xenorhabdus hominickii]|uniref:Uncharacterized protein n=1 Tax=Xenorhabdus hominickii TaxID=351679 RepID=A0A2G0QDD1_XENHO|nr:hypothetical protein [Xenorhabdus hominickii]PHM55424.1 hypothetical protein Xhom_02162 [Xenorhabdus hominickii]PHM57211.1 hypothetical protein Xhom_00173 [Xenorhabdus hominickii]
MAKSAHNNSELSIKPVAIQFSSSAMKPTCLNIKRPVDVGTVANFCWRWFPYYILLFLLLETQYVVAIEFHFYRNQILQ